MSFGTALVVIAAIIAFTVLKLAQHYSRQERIDRKPAAHEHDERMAQTQELQELRERIKVLERIATDGNTLDAAETRRISQEIEALRDRQAG